MGTLLPPTHGSRLLSRANSTLGSHRGLCLKQEGRNVSGPTHKAPRDLACSRLFHFQVNELASASHELASAKTPKLTNLHFQLTKFTQDLSRVK